MVTGLAGQEIPEGYKQTEVGVIPAEWEVKPLSDFIASLEAGVSVNSVDETENSIHEKAILKTSCIYGGNFYPEEAKIILPKDLKRAKLNPRKNSIIVSRMNTPALVGEVGFIDDNYYNLFLPDRLWQTKYKNEKTVDGKWLSFILSFPNFANKIKETATETSNSMKNISKDNFLSVRVPSPSKKEQTTIANALSDVDSLITSLTKVIEKKRAIKTAAMGQLLTGKKRLPPFDKKYTGYKQTEVGVIPEDWEVNKIGDICTIFGRIGFRGYTKKDIVDENQGVISISPSNIKDGKFNFDKCTYLTWEKYYESPEIKVYENDIILVKTGSTFGKVAIVKNLPCKATLNPQVVVFKKLKAVSAYLGYLMQFDIVQDQISSAIVGGAIPTLSQKLVSLFLIPRPSFEEQTAIAEVLSDMDKEIEALEKRLAKTQKIKQGMMQELLTGRTRLL